MFTPADIIRKLFNKRNAKPAEVPQLESGATVDFVDRIAKKYGLVADRDMLSMLHRVDYVIDGNLRIPDGYNKVCTIYSRQENHGSLCTICIKFYDNIYVNPQGMVMLCDSYVENYSPLANTEPEYIENFIKTILDKVDKALIEGEITSISAAKQDLERIFEQCSQN